MYYNYTLSNNGKAEQHHFDYATDYLVDLLANRSAAWLIDTATKNPKADIFAMVGTPAAHGPFDPAPQYAQLFPEAIAPRTLGWNANRTDKHWLISGHKPMGPPEIAYSDLSYRRRLMTIKSLDDLVGKLATALTIVDRMDQAYFFFTSDNGFHMGQFSMPDDKRLPYETDIRVPLIVKIPHGAGFTTPRRSKTAVLNIDLAPTLLSIADIEVPVDMDGVSYATSLTDSLHWVPRTFLIEYHGEYGHGSDGAYMPLPLSIFKTPPYFTVPGGSKMQDCRNNTYSCLRQVSPEQNLIFCYFYANDSAWAVDMPYFTEYYNLTSDPYQLSNAEGSLQPSAKVAMAARLSQLRSCVGRNCSVI